MGIAFSFVLNASHDFLQNDRCISGDFDAVEAQRWLKAALPVSKIQLTFMTNTVMNLSLERLCVGLQPEIP